MIDKCTRCNELLIESRMVWLELSTMTGLYTDPAKVSISEDESQGCFAFGRDCARRVLKNGGRTDMLWGKK